MIIVLHGPDIYRRRQKLREIITHYRRKHSALTVELFYLDEAPEMARLSDFLTAQSLFDDWKMAVVHYPFNAENQNEAARLLRDQREKEMTVVLISADREPPVELDFLLKKPVIAQPFATLSGAHWKTFILDEARQRKVSLTSSQLNAFLMQGEGDSWAAVNELDKLALLPHQKLSFTGYGAQGEVFDAVRRLAEGEVQFRLPILERLLDGEEAAKIFNLLAYTVSGDRRRQMADYDAAIKSGKLEYEEALLDALISPTAI